MTPLSDRQHDAFDNDAKMACRQGNLRALREAAYMLWEDGETVSVAAGLYDNPTNGEAFPLVVPAGVTLIGEEATRGNSGPTKIVGCGSRFR